MNEKKQSPLFGVGGVTLLTVLLVLALTMFAVLTLSSAQADLRLSEKNAHSVRGYYAADSKAVRLQAKAAAMWPLGRPRPAAFEMENALAADYDITVWSEMMGLMIHCDIPILAGEQTLKLVMHLAPPEDAGRWRVEKWQFVPPDMEISDEPGLPVWMGF
jgi:hypothetical protein